MATSGVGKEGDLDNEGIDDAGYWMFASSASGDNCDPKSRECHCYIHHRLCCLQNLKVSKCKMLPS